MSRSGRESRTAASFEVIAESIPHLVWLADPSGSTDYFNERATGYTGLPRQANYGWKWVELVHPDDAERARLGWEHSTRTATPYELSYRIRRADGEFRWHAFRALPVRGGRGQILRWIGTADDIQDTPRAATNAARVARQISELRVMLDVVQPAGREQFGFVAPERRTARVNEALRGSGAAARPVEDGAMDHLTSRNLSVLRLIATGYTSAEIANLLGLSLRSIETNRARIRRHLGLHTRAGLVRFARDTGLVDPGR